MKKKILVFTVLIAIFIVCLAAPFHAGATPSIRVLYKCNNTSATVFTLIIQKFIIENINRKVILAIDGFTLNKEENCGKIISGFK